MGLSGLFYPAVNPKGQEMNQATIYTTSWCPSCVNAKAFFETKGVTYTEIDVERWDDPRGRLESITGRRSVTVERRCTELGIHQDGVLDELLKSAAVESAAT